MKEQVSGSQLVFMLLWLILGTGVLTLPNAINTFARYQDGWITAGLMMLVPLLFAIIARPYVRYNADKSFYAALTSTFGRTLSLMMTAWISLWLYICACAVVREFILFIELNFLPNTPIYILSGIIIFATVYCISQGIETLARMAILVSAAYCIGITINSLLMVTAVHIQYTLPILSEGWRPVIESALYPWLFNSEIFVGLLFVNKIQYPHRLPRYFIYAGILITFVSLIMEFLSISVLGNVGRYSIYPLLSAIRSLSIGMALQRLEPLYVILVVFSLVIKLGFFQVAFTDSVQELIRIEHRENVVWGLGLIVWAGSIFFFHNASELNEYILFSWPAYTATVTLFLPLFLLTVQSLRRHTG